MRAEVVADDRDPDRCGVQRAQVAAEFQEPGPGLARLDVPVQLVLAQLIGGEQVPDPGRAGVGRAQPAPRLAAGLFALAADRGPLPPGPGCRFSGPNSSTQNTISGSPGWGLTSRPAMAYSSSTRAFFAANCGSLEAFQVFSR